MLEWFIRMGAFAALCTVSLSALAADEGQLRPVGVARIDITPDYPIRLTGYASRKKESEGVAQHLWAKALAIGGDKDGPAILITVDNCGVPANVRDEVVRRLQQKRHIKPERVAICSTHTHSAPWLKGFAPNIFGAPIPPEQQARVERYTREVTDALETVALHALQDRRPAKLSRGLGRAGFAANRRTKGGPVDQDLPVLFVTDPEGKLRAIFASYACHCTTLGGEFNQCCGDWAGYAQEYLEREHPGAIVLIALGCAGDANPSPRTGLDLAKQHGQEICAAVDRVLANALLPVEGRLVCRTKQIRLPLDTLPTRAEWEARARETNYIGSFARMNLARLDRGETLPTDVPYLVQTWTFGKGLAMVFLTGEVVVDYSLRLKKEYDASRLWINAYANDVPCYIASERILKEGGYEGGGAMVFYDKPARLAPGVENLIVGTVHELLPKELSRCEQKATTGTAKGDSL
jgi:Neutral/alkaline non-lysosomal ceramidase, N-terminal